MGMRKTAMMAGVAFALALGPSRAVAQFIYWADFETDKIQRVRINGSHVENILGDELTSPAGLALDLEAGKLYATDNFFANRRILRANLDGTDVEDIVTVDSSTDVPDIFFRLALDAPGGKIYWTGFDDDATGVIMRANLDGSETETLVAILFSVPSGIALDVAGGKMYWAQRVKPSRIMRANLDGSDVEVLVTTTPVIPRGIALDVTSGKVYWVGTLSPGVLGIVQRANLDGSEVEELLTTGIDPSAIALDLDQGWMYWTDAVFGDDSVGFIRRARLDGSDVQDLVTTGLGQPLGIALDLRTEPVPTVSDVGVAMLGVMILVAGAILSRRRRWCSQ